MTNKKEVIKEAELINEDEKTKKSSENLNDSENKNYANFWQRLCAFIIDIFIVSTVTSLFTQPFANSKKIENLSDEAYEVIEQYKNKKIDMNTYVDKTTTISYEISRSNGLLSIIGIAISILYFVVYQFKFNGQTIGKKLLKIKIVKRNKGILNINDFLFRSLIINFILFDIISLCFLVFSTRKIYFYGVGFFQFIQYAIIFISCIMILSKKNKQGLHDVLVNTEVIKV